MKEVLRVPGYVRYMDDFGLFADEKGALRDALAAVERFLVERLRLRLKERATILAPVTQGFPFLGWRIYRGTTRLRPENLGRTRRRLRLRAWQTRTGRISEQALADAARSVTAHLAHGSTLALRQRMFAGP